MERYDAAGENYGASVLRSREFVELEPFPCENMLISSLARPLGAAQDRWAVRILVPGRAGQPTRRQRARWVRPGPERQVS